MAHILTADPWDADPFDVESINAEVSDHILREIASITTEGADWSKQPRTSATLVLGTAGAGKTHLFARLRGRLGLAACFVHVRPLFGTPPSQRLVLGAILDALAHRTAPNGLTQVDLLAGSVLARAMDLGKRPNAAIEVLRDAPDREKRLARLAEQVERSVRALHGPTLRHVLRLPFSEGVERQARLRYLEGEELTEEEAAALGMKAGFPARLSDVDATRAVTTIGRLASLATPLVVAFDQLENLDTGGDASRAVLFGHLIRELHDTAPGLVLVLLALDDLWRTRIGPALPEAARAAIGRQPRTLRNPTPDEKDALLRGWRERDPELAAHPFPYPFSVEAWTGWQRETSATPRVLLEELDAWHEGRRAEAASARPTDDAEPAAATLPSDDVGRSAAGAIEDDLSRRIGAAHDEVRRSGSAHPIGVTRLAAALAQVLQLAGDGAVRGASDDELVVDGAAGRRRLIVAQHTNHTSLGAALRRALTDDAVLAVRETRVPLRASWKVCRELQASLAEDARWIDLDPDDVAWAVGVHDLMAAARSGEVVDDRGRTVDAATVTSRCEALTGASPVVRRLRPPGRPAVAVAAPPAPAKPAVKQPAKAAPKGTARAAAKEPAKGPAEPAAKPARTTPSASATSARASATPAAAKPGSRTIRHTTPAGAVLERLGVASVDRVLRELRLDAPSASRASVLEELGRDDSVTFLGPSVVASRALRR